ncbi:lipocalin Can f 6.0101 isoform X2 [Ursus maritimus]|uniref:Allergen Fel d 4-like n=1 Tax=Ursus maritimus TaxID=29073 RepID=A0A384DHA1_URSMA|nr:lipocalin Can f 6.0101 isoform X2 [Ursus maritimus]
MTDHFTEWEEERWCPLDEKTRSGPDIKTEDWRVEPPAGRDSLSVTVGKTVPSPAKMKLLVLCLGLILVCAHEEGNDVVRRNFDVSKISGYWYSVLLASDVREKIEENGSMRVFVNHIEVLSNSSLFFNMHIKVDGKCTELALLSDKTEKDGDYSVEYDGYNVFRIVETDYTDYIIFHLVNFNEKDSFQLIELYAREPDTSEEVKKNFVEYCQKHGIVKENIFNLTEVDRCLQARGSEEAQDSSAE